MRGACDLRAVSHYLQFAAKAVYGEFNLVRGPMAIRLDHSSLIVAALQGRFAEPTFRDAAVELGYLEGDFDSELLHREPEMDAYLFSFWQDAALATYRHRRIDLSLPCAVNGLSYGLNLMNVAAEDLQSIKGLSSTAQIEGHIECLRRDFDHEHPSLGRSERDIRFILDILPGDALVVLLLAPEYFTQANGDTTSYPLLMAHNTMLVRLAAGYPNLRLVRVTDFVESPAELPSPLHFDRMVYYRLAMSLSETIGRASLARYASIQSRDSAAGPTAGGPGGPG